MESTGAEVLRGGGWRAALLCGVVLAGYGNLLNLLAYRVVGVRRTMVSIAGPLALLAGALHWHHRVDRQPLALIGLHARGWRRGLAWGALAGTGLAIPPVVSFWLPRRRGTAMRFDEVYGLGRTAFLVRLLATTPVLVALCEEVAFRGLLQGKLHRAAPARPAAAVGLSSLAFALWHVTVNVYTLRKTNVVTGGMLPLPAALAGGLGAVFVGGLVFGDLFRRTGSLVAPLVAHWLVDVLMLLALYQRSPARPGQPGMIHVSELPDARGPRPPSPVGEGARG
jgi:membrane protease YdiL (CAAX protease family)